MNIFVGNLASSVTTDDLRRLFSGYGTIINVIVMKDTESGLPLGYGHVYLVSENAALEAMLALNRTTLNGSQIDVRECVYRMRREQRTSRRAWTGVERRVSGARRHNGHMESAPLMRRVQ
ncbi:MAG: RNA-binding protein [Pseudomonadota bacterium]